MIVLLKNINRKWLHLRFKPIHVFCLHHVSNAFDAESMNKGDWMQIDNFKRKVLDLQRDGVKFISLTEAYNKITNDKWRNIKYAVLTFDDGYASLKEILPWLEEQHIPATLFINGKYLDGKSFRDSPKEQYLNKEELFSLTSPLIEIGSHGWEHTNAIEMGKPEFEESMKKNIQLLSSHPCYVPFHAYTWGAHSNESDALLYKMKTLPVLIDGLKNYNEPLLIHRLIL